MNTLQQIRSTWSSGKTCQVFFGGQGTRTSFHCAGEHSLFSQVHGKKHWHFIEPKALSIGVGLQWFDLFDNLSSNTTGTALTLMATNPPIWTATKRKTDFATIFKHMQSKS